MDPVQSPNPRFPLDYREVKEGIVYRTASLADSDTVFRLMVDDFFPNMPLFVNPPTVVPPELVRELVDTLLPQGVSLIAENAGTGEPVGARLNGVDCASERCELPSAPEQSAPEHERCWQILSMVKVLESKVDCFQRYGVDKALTFKAVVVKQSYGKRQIGRTLNQLAMAQAAKAGLQLVTGSTESFYSQRMNESLGMEAVNRIRYRDYMVEGTGERPFLLMDATVHKEAVMFAMALPVSQE